MNIILLQVEAAEQGSPWTFWVMVLLIILIVVTIKIIKRKRENRRSNERNNFQIGDKIVTKGGLYGEILQIKNNAIVVKLQDGIETTLSRDSLTLVEKTKYTPIFCPTSGKSYDAHYEFCPHCGEIKVKTCPNPQCRCTNLPIDAEYCPMCGQKL